MSAAWVKSGLPPLAGPLPAWVILPLPFQLFNMASVLMWSITVTLLLMAIVLKSQGRSLLWVVRRLRSRIRGHRIEARPIGYRRAMTMDKAIDEFDFDIWRAN